MVSLCHGVDNADWSGAFALHCAGHTLHPPVGCGRQDGSAELISSGHQAHSFWLLACSLQTLLEA